MAEPTAEAVATEQPADAAATEQPAEADDAAATEQPAEADDAAAEQLHALGEELFQLQAEAAELESRLNRPAVRDAAIKEVAAAVPVLGGRVQTFEARLDAAAAGSEALRQRRRELVQQAAELGERVQQLPPLLETKVAETADRHKAEGNAHYKASEFEAAIRCYSAAIATQRTNPVYWSNRSACHQAVGGWAQALSDARQCLALDVGFFKGYLHAVRCQLQLDRLAEAAETLRSAPLALAGHAELQALAATLQEAIKTKGNACFKASK